MVYDDVFCLWETIWAAKHTSSEHFVLFVALALVETYRDIILENNMDFTDIIKFFNGKMEVSYKQQIFLKFFYYYKQCMIIKVEPRNIPLSNVTKCFQIVFYLISLEIKHPAKKRKLKCKNEQIYINKSSTCFMVNDTYLSLPRQKWPSDTTSRRC